MNEGRYNQNIQAKKSFSQPIFCQGCDMEFQSEGLLMRHMNHGCLEGPSQKAQKKPQQLWNQQQQQQQRQRQQPLQQQQQHQQQQRDRFTDEAESHLRKSSELRERRIELERSRQEVEAELRALERVRLKKEMTAKQNLARIALQQSQNSLALQQLRSVRDSQGLGVRLTEEDEKQLLELMKMRQRCMGREGENSEILHHIANLERSVIEKASKATTAQQQQQQQEQEQPKKDKEENKDMIRQMARLEEENGRLRREFERLQDLNRDFMHQQQTMMLQRDLVESLVKRATQLDQPASKNTPRGSEERDRLDLMRHEEEMSVMRLRLEEMERKIKENQLVNNNNTSNNNNSSNNSNSNNSNSNNSNNSNNNNSSSNSHSNRDTSESSPTLSRSPNRSPLVPSDKPVKRSPVLRSRVAPSSESSIPNQGFRLMFDYVRGLTRDVELAKLYFSLYSGLIVLKRPTPIQCINPDPQDSGLEHIFKFCAKQPVLNGIPDSELAVLLTLEVTYADGTEVLVGWNKINLFEGFENSVPNNGKWKISLRKPPVHHQSSKAERNAMRTKFTTVDVYMRLLMGSSHDDDEDLPTDYSVYNVMRA